MTIKVLGSGCPSCKRLYENVKDAANILQRNIQVEYITDLNEIIALGILRTPALVFDDKIVSVGKVLTSNEVVEKIKKYI